MGYSPWGRKQLDTTARLHPTLITIYASMLLTKTHASETLAIFGFKIFIQSLGKKRNVWYLSARAGFPES